MTRISRITTILLAGAALPMLAACGADDIASPGSPNVVINNPPAPPVTPTPAPPTAVGPQNAPTGALSTISPQLATLVQTQGFVDEGVVEFGAAASTAGAASPNAVASAFRVIRLPSLISDDDTRLPYVPGVAYLIDGTVNVGIDVGGGATPNSTGRSTVLTIEAGAILFADNGAAGDLQRVTVDANGNQTRADVEDLSQADGPDYMVINRGSRIVANGTSTRPIIFTARQNLEGTATDAADNAQGLWGGLILAGRAPISDCNTSGVAGGAADCFRIVEGTGSVRFGGELATDNSGSLRYVQLRYSGIAISEGNELQGLTPAGVGSDTVIDHIQVHNSADDGVEIFGGRVNAKYLLVTGADDDDLDTDFGYKGSVQFVLGVKRTGNGSGDPRSLEVDSSSNRDALPRQYLRLANFTFINEIPTEQVLYIRGGADVALMNGIVKSTVKPCLDIDHSETVRAADGPLDDLGPPTFNSVLFECSTGIQDDAETGGLTVAAIQALFTAGSNNSLAATGSLTSTFITAGTTTAFDAATLRRGDEPNALQTTDFVGAVRDANDSWYKGWSCTPSYLPDLTGTLGACTSIPVYSAS